MQRIREDEQQQDGEDEIWHRIAEEGDEEHALSARLSSLPVENRAALIPSVSPLGTDGLLLRAAAVSVEELLRTTRAWLSFLPPLLGDDPWARRV